jgi:ubiquinone biosynthesis protein
LKRAFRHLVRLCVIMRTLGRYDALFLLERAEFSPAVTLAARFLAQRPGKHPGRPGERLAAACHALGPSFIKLGQALSVRSDLLGEELAEDLSALQDRLPPFPAAEARATVEAELGRPLHELFSSFDEFPVAAASIAQVHYAATVEGTPVAVKVLRPSIEAAFARDIELFDWLAGIVERRLPELRRLKPRQVVASFRDVVTLEMDLRLEAAAAAELAENLAADPDQRIPKVDWQRTARRVLTLERIAGIPIDERETLLDAGHDPVEIVARAANGFFNQVFRDGFFHADMHPGNLFVDEEGRIVMVDFGIMGRLERKTRHYLAEMLTGFLAGDYQAVAEVHFRAGYVPASKSMAAFAQACRAIGEPIRNRPLNEISLARLLGQLFQVTAAFEMETRLELLLLQKSMLLAEGVGRKLAPEINMWALARPLIEEWMRANRGPEAMIGDAVRSAGEALQRLPTLAREIEIVIDQLARGGLRLHPESLAAVAGGRGRDRALLWLAWAATVLLAIAILVTLL